MQVKCVCGETFTSRLAPCPDGHEGCLVAHFGKESFVCPECGHNSGPDIGKAIREGHVTTEVGIGVANVKGIEKLHLRA